MSDAIIARTETAKEALDMLRAYITLWQEDKAHGLTPTDVSMERARRRIDIIEAALNEKEPA